MPAVEQRYVYPAASSLADAKAGKLLALATDRAGTDGQARSFLTAQALFPEITARSLRAVSEIVGARFYVPPAMLGRILREADPVVTVSPDAVRFEGFAACCSAYIRLDLRDDALAVQHRRHGTTNVDFGPELRGALAKIDKDSRLELGVGADAVQISHDGQAIVEKKVPLPRRWIRGFAEVQVVMRDMVPAFRLPRVAAQRLLRSLPRSKDDTLHWVSWSGGIARLSARERQGAIPLRGGHRLKVLDALVARAESIAVFVNAQTGATAWVMELGAQQLSLVLNAEPWRGFSGDGGLLTQIATSDGAATAAVRAQLNWQSRIDVPAMSETTGLPPASVDAALAELAAMGLVGFDLLTGAYFHRVLPFDLDLIAALNPRLQAAEKLVAAGAVTLRDDAEADVQSAQVTHRVQRGREGWRCTCPWFAKNGAKRGPCKHILAVEIVLEQPA